MKITVILFLAMFAFSGSARSQPVAACAPFTQFPLSLNFGQAPSGAGGESIRCANTKFMTAINALYAQRAVANGIATLDGSGRLVGSQLPSSADFQSATLTSSSPGPACLSTDGHYATDGTSSWEPTCFGTFMSNAQSVKVYPTRGTAKGPDGNPSYKMFTSNLIQSQANGNIEKETNAQFINLDVVGGAISAAGLDSTNAVGQLISVRQRPDAQGRRPPTTWGHNIDFHIAAGSGNVQSYGVEYDINNFNKNCYPGSGCLSSAMFFNGISGWTNTAWLYSGGGTTQSRSLSVTVANGVVTRVAGEQFNRAVYRINIGGSLYRVHYVSPDRVDADVAIPNQPSPVAATWQNAMVANGILFQGENNASDNDIHLATSAYNGVNVSGNHQVAFNTSNDQARYALIAGAGQSVCLNAFSSCLSYNDQTQSLQYGSQFQFGDNGNMSIGGGLQASNISTGGLRVFTSSPPQSASTQCNQGTITWDVNYTYICVEANTWKRSALSSW
jgi:hypothetical protein